MRQNRHASKEATHGEDDAPAPTRRLQAQVRRPRRHQRSAHPPDTASAPSRWARGGLSTRSEGRPAMSNRDRRSSKQQFPAKTEKKGFKPNTGYKPDTATKPVAPPKPPSGGGAGSPQKG